ncbi:MAG: hypothetical protein GY816_04545 [Cytophagales bacterium]|nr:hypothetical protein [Cytophagales bacterium]
MIKKIFLNHLSKKKAKTENESVSFQQARSIGILTTYDSSELNWKVVSNLEGEGKNTRVISFVNNPIKGETYPAHTFTSKDVSLIGNILSYELLYFCKQKYDFLLCLDTTGSNFIKYILAKTEATHKIGLYDPSLEGILDMMIKPTTENPIVELVRYAKMIRHD